MTKNIGLKKASLIRLTVYAGILLFSNTLFAAHNYNDALYKSVYFLGANRCGDTKSWIHGACHLRDGEVNGGIDLTGGWHDCGDHVKFGQTNSFAAGCVIEGYLQFTSAYEDRYAQDYSAPPANGIPDVLDEVKIHTDFLIKAYRSGTVYYQVGNGDQDHVHFSEPVYQGLNYTAAEGGNPRPSYSITTGGSNVCGDAAAALALMSIAYRPFNAAYADQCLTVAKQYYAVGDAAHNIRASTGVGYATNTNWADDLCWGAISIYRANNEAFYLTEAQGLATDGNFSMPTYWALCWDHTEPLAIYGLYKATGNASYMTLLTTELTNYQGKMTTCGIGSYAWLAQWGSLRYSGGMAFVAALIHKENNSAAALDFCKKNVDFILGTHAAMTGTGGGTKLGESFLIGYENPDYPGTGWPQRPHHRAAFGKGASGDIDFADEDAAPGTVPYLHTLTGALVGGPRATCSNYNDDIGDYVANEVGLDYNAGFIGAVAHMAQLYPQATPTYTPFAGPPTFTPTPTGTRTITVSPTASRTPSFTRTGTPTRTTTNTPADTFTATETNTNTVTRTHTATGTYTATATITQTDTPPPPGSTDTFTPSITKTFTVSPVATGTFTSTIQPSQTWTLTRTPLPTATNTAQFTKTNTPAATYTRTPLPTATRTPAINTPTPTYTQVITAPPSEEVVYPNPYDPGEGDLNVDYRIEASATTVKFTVFTSSYRMVLSADLGTAPAGYNSAAINRKYFEKLSNGSYMYLITYKTASGEKRSKIRELIVVR